MYEKEKDMFLLVSNRLIQYQTMNLSYGTISMLRSIPRFGTNKQSILSSGRTTMKLNGLWGVQGDQRYI